MGRNVMVCRAGEDIAAEIVMMRTSSKGPFVVVEGPTDERFLWPRVRKSCYISIGSGRTSVEKAMQILDGVGKSNDCLGIVDEDYDWLINYQPISPNVIKTDPRDVEGLLFRSGALDAALAEFANRAAVQELERQEGPVLAAVLERAEPFGRIRMVNSVGPMVDMSKFKPVRFCRNDWSYDMDEAMNQAVALGISSDIGTLAISMEALGPPDIWHCVRGHDLVDIFMGGLIYKLGARGVDRVALERVMRQALSPSEFSTSLLFARLDAWGRQNTPVLN